jgi:hypothetical protein
VRYSSSGGLAHHHDNAGRNAGAIADQVDATVREATRGRVHLTDIEPGDDVTRYVLSPFPAPDDRVAIQRALHEKLGKNYTLTQRESQVPTRDPTMAAFAAVLSEPAYTAVVERRNPPALPRPSWRTAVMVAGHVALIGALGWLLVHVSGWSVVASG